MSAPILVSALGTTFAIDAGVRSEPFRESIAAAWADARLPAGSPSATIVADVLGEDDEARQRIHDEVTRMALSHVRPGIWVLRAAGVADAHGAVALLLGGDGAGLEGLTIEESHSQRVVSERYVGIDATGALLPFPEPHGGDGGECVCRAQEERREGPATLRVARIIVIDSRAEGRDILSETREADHVARALVASSVNLPLIPSPLRRVADLLEICAAQRVATVPPSVWGEPSPAMTGDLASHWLRSNVHAAAAAESPIVAGKEARRYFRGPVRDARTLADGRCVVLEANGTAATLTTLSPADTEIWQRADGVERASLGGAGGRIDEMVEDGLLGLEPAWRIGDGVAWVSDDSRTTVLGSASPSEPVVALEGSAHVIWTVLAEEGVLTQSQLVRLCAHLFDAAVDELSAPVESLLADLNTRGAVVRV